MKSALKTSSDDGYVPLSNAHQNYCRPDLLKSLNRAGELAGHSTSKLQPRIKGLTSRNGDKKAAAKEFAQAQKAVEVDLIEKLQDGRLSAIGQPKAPLGATATSVPIDELKSPDTKIDLPNDEISARGFTYTDVRTAPGYEAEDFPNTLSGFSLADCFQTLVLEDWLYHEQASYILDGNRDWEASYEERTPYHMSLWPVRFEDWPHAAQIVEAIKYPVFKPKGLETTPPDEVVALRRRVDRQTSRLLRWFRCETLVAEGVREPKEDDPSHIPIPSSWWNQENVEVNFKDNSLYVVGTSDDGKRYSQIRVVAGVSAIRKPSLATREEEYRPKGKPGRKPIWDWHGATREMVRLANTPDGLPWPQSRLESHIADWFIGQTGNSPSESRTREFVSGLLPADYHSEN